MLFGDDKAKTLPPMIEKEVPMDQFTKSYQNKDKNEQKITDENLMGPKTNKNAARKIKNIQTSNYEEEISSLPCSKKSKSIIRTGDSESSVDAEIFPKYPRRKIFSAREGSALEFVRKLRRDALNNPIPAPAKTREQEISEIGVSMQQRVAVTARSSNLILPKSMSSVLVGKKFPPYS